MLHYTIQCFNEYFTGGFTELRSHFIINVLEEIKRLFVYTENPKSRLSS